MEVRGFEGRIEIGDERQLTPDAPFTAVNADNRQALKDLLDNVRELQKKRGGVSGALTITMPCGGVWTIKTYSDIPFGDLPCPCGADGHYLMRYKKEQ